MGRPLYLLPLEKVEPKPQNPNPPPKPPVRRRRRFAKVIPKRLSVIHEADNPADQWSQCKKRVKGRSIDEELARIMQEDDQQETLKKIDFKHSGGKNGIHKFDEQETLDHEAETLNVGRVQKRYKTKKGGFNAIVHQKQSQNLRNKFLHLLEGNSILSIGQPHKKLIETMGYIDRCLQLFHSRGNFEQRFSLVEKTIQRSMRAFIKIQSLKQLVFLDPNIYKLEYRKNDYDDYDLVIGFYNNKVQKEGIRKQDLRDKIVCYLKVKYQAHLKNLNINDDFETNKSWEHGFNPNLIEIPEGQLPQNPQDVPNYLEQPSEEEQTSSSSKTISIINRVNQRMSKSKIIKDIFAKKIEPTTFKQKLEEIVRLKQAQLKEEIKKNEEKPQIFCKKELLSFCEQACQLFIQRGVNNLFLSNFLTMMMKRIKANIIKTEKILSEVLTHESKFLSKSTIPKNGLQMIRIDQEKYKEINSSYSKNQ